MIKVMFKDKLLEDLKKVVGELGYQSSDIVLSIPKNSSFGDYTTNIALQLAKQDSKNDKQNPLTIANQISKKLKGLEFLKKVEVAGSGFINFFINEHFLMNSLHQVCDYSSLVDPKIEVAEGNKKKVMIEFTDPNPFKEFHVGHLFSNIIGESLSRLLESTGAEVKRVNYFGDVGMHVAKSVWGMKKKIKDFEDNSLEERVKFLGEAYVLGSKAFEEDPKAKEEIIKINQDIYLGKGGELYDKGRAWSLEYFETIYVKVGTKFDYYYPESSVAEIGKQLVLEYLEKGVFEESEGAVIFPGEKYGLHRRVFINSLGLPTYEAKELGLAVKKYQDYQYDQSIIVTGNEIKEYFQVLMMALSQINPELARKATHIPHGMVRMIGGKISSRKGNVPTFVTIFDFVKDRVKEVMKDSEIEKEEKQQIIDIVSIGAIKFSMLKSSPHMDVTFDLERSVSLQGDSGPYLQYTYARAKSVLRNASYNYNASLQERSDYNPTEIKHQLEDEERELLRSIEHFSSIVADAASNLSPNTIATYLMDFARSFNLFYQKHHIIESDQSEFRLALTCAVAVVLKQGLNLLGIEAPERM